jgi:hypothetical protein
MNESKYYFNLCYNKDLDTVLSPKANFMLRI